MSDTPRTDMAQYFNYDDSDKPEPLGMVDVEFTRKLETELNTAIVNEAFAENKVYMIEKQLKQANERIKQLEEMYEGEPGERPDLLGSNVMGLLKRELNAAQDRIKRLEKDSERLAWLLKTGLAWRGCYNDYWSEGEWLYSSQYAIATIDKAKEAKL